MKIGEKYDFTTIHPVYEVGYGLVVSSLVQLLGTGRVMPS